MFDLVVAHLDPALTAIGFAAGQGGVTGDSGQVIYCRAHPDGGGLCADVVLTFRNDDRWQVTDVSYDGFTVGQASRLRLALDVGLSEQLTVLATTIPEDING